MNGNLAGSAALSQTKDNSKKQHSPPHTKSRKNHRGKGTHLVKQTDSKDDQQSSINIDEKSRQETARSVPLNENQKDSPDRVETHKDIGAPYISQAPPADPYLPKPVSPPTTPSATSLIVSTPPSNPSMPNPHSSRHQAVEHQKAPPSYTANQWALHCRLAQSHTENQYVKATPQKTKPITFTLSCGCTEFGENLRIVGCIPQLGNWDPENGVPLVTDKASFPIWTTKTPIEFDLDNKTPITYKYVRALPNGSFRWEDDIENREVRLSMCESKENQDIIVDDHEFNDSRPSMNLPRIRLISKEWKEKTHQLFTGDWRLLPDRSDLLRPLLDATGVSWVIKTALEYTSKYDVSLRVSGDRLVTRTHVDGGDDTQIMSLSGILHNTRELDGETYTCVCGWDEGQQQITAVRHSPKRGEMTTVRRIISQAKEPLVMETLVSFIPDVAGSPTTDVKLYFEQISKG